MKKIKFKRLISLLLCITMIIPQSIGVFANDLISESTEFEGTDIDRIDLEGIDLEDFDFEGVDLEDFDLEDIDFEEYQSSIDESLSIATLDSEEQNDYLIQMIEDMTPEARSILENHLKNEDPENYEFYIENINPAAEIDTLNLEVNTYAANSMAVLGRDLAALGFSNQVVIALKAAAADILALGAITGPAVATILTAAAISAIIAANWNVIGPKWNQVVSAFQKAIAKSTSAIAQGFATAGTQFKQRVSDSEKAKNRFRTCPKAAAVAKHVDIAFLNKFLRNSNNEAYKVFYSSKNRIAMIMIKIRKGNKGSINKSFGDDSTISHKYSEKDIDLGGFTMYLLYNCATDKLFHCHVRYRTDDTNEMRKANGLDWMVYPKLERNMKYYTDECKLNLKDNQLN